MKPAVHPNAGQPSTARGAAAALRSVPSRAKGPRLPDASREAKRVAATLLEVLAGAATPTAAASTLGVSLPRFYLLEQRAIQAFVTACEPRTGGRAVSPNRELDLLRKQVDRLQRECTRNQTLLRVAQRTIGLVPPAANAAKDKLSAKTKRKRRPTARALVAARALRANDEPPAAPTDAAAINHVGTSIHPHHTHKEGQQPTTPEKPSLIETAPVRLEIDRRISRLTHDRALGRLPTRPISHP
jgi:hypothetical protein